MSVKKIVFKVNKASTYYTLGSVRFYDEDDNIYPITFPLKDQSLENTFYIQGTNITGNVNTTNSYTGYYFVDSPFDTDKPVTTTYPQKNYWLSSNTDTISISFNSPIKISKIDFIPYCGDGTDRKQNTVEITAIDHSDKVALSKVYDTSAYVINQVYTAITDQLLINECTLLKSKNKIYSLKPIYTWYEIKMNSYNSPSPFTITGSGDYSSYYLWKAFDGVKTSANSWNFNSGDKAWIQIDFGSARKANSVKITGSLYAFSYSPSSIKIYGSLNNVDFKELFSVDNLTWVANEEKTIDFNNHKNYRYYKLEVLSSAQGNWVGLTEICYGYSGLELQTIPTTTSQNFIYGLGSVSRLNLPVVKKSYVLQDSNTKSLDMLLTTKLDKKPLSISCK